MEEFNRSGSRPSSFPGHWTRPDVRGALVAMQGRICAYCGADISEAGIDVEHFRPKSNVEGDDAHGGYWWLAYDFTNYVLSCIPCNQRCKKDRFPLGDGATRVAYAVRDTLAAEQRILFDPSIDPVEDWIAFDWQSPAGRLIPNPNLAPELKTRVAQTLRFFRVNLKPAQRRKRADLQRVVLQRVDQNKASDVRELAIRYHPHSIVAKQILAEKAPAVLPTPVEELEWLLNQLTSDLISKLEDLQDPAASELDENEAKELLWALAVLWRDPPAATPDFVSELLERRGLRDSVAPYHALL